MSILYGIIVKNKISTTNPLLFKNELSLLLEVSSNCTNFYRDKNNNKLQQIDMGIK